MYLLRRFGGHVSSTSALDRFESREARQIKPPPSYGIKLEIQTRFYQQQNVVVYWESFPSNTVIVARRPSAIKVSISFFSCS